MTGRGGITGLPGVALSRGGSNESSTHHGNTGGDRLLGQFFAVVSVRAVGFAFLAITVTVSVATYLDNDFFAVGTVVWYTYIKQNKSCEVNNR